MPVSAPARQARATSQRHAVLLTVPALVVLWLTVGFLRAPMVASDYLARMERPKYVSDVTTSAFPGVPPFWIVSVQGMITEASGATYTAAEIVWVEPVTGWAVTFAAG